MINQTQHSPPPPDGIVTLKVIPAGIAATGKVSSAGQVKGNDPDEKGYLGSPCWGLGIA
jgi:hypothetical protein